MTTTEDRLRAMLDERAGVAGGSAEPTERVLRGARRRRARTAVSTLAVVAVVVAGAFTGLKAASTHAADVVSPRDDWKTRNTFLWSIQYPPAWYATWDHASSSSGSSWSATVLGNTKTLLHRTDQGSWATPAMTPRDVYAVVEGPVVSAGAYETHLKTDPRALKIERTARENGEFFTIVFAGAHASRHDLATADAILGTLTFTPAAPQTPGLRPTTAPGAEIETVSSLAAIDGMHAWALVTTKCDSSRTIDCPAHLLATAGGGSSWTTVRIPSAVVGRGQSASSETPVIGDVLFLDDQHGWLFGENAFSTRDGGTTWTKDEPLPLVAGMSQKNGRLWMLGCLRQDLPGCDITVRSSTDAGRTWTAAVTVGNARTAGSIVALDAQSAVVQIPQDPVANKAGLRLTRDGGKTWTDIAKPDGCDFASVIPSGVGPSLWLMCGGQPGAGQQEKSFYEYGGAGTWRVAADKNHVPSSGYVGPMAATPGGTFWLALDRNAIYSSSDGGATWKLGAVRDDAGEGFGSLVFTDDATGWLEQGRTVWTTADGGQSWEAHPLPAIIPR